MSDAAATAETAGELVPLAQVPRDGTAQLTMIPGDADDELRHLIYEAGATLAANVEVSAAIRDHLGELKNRHQREGTVCEADFRTRLSPVDRLLNARQNLAAIGEYSVSGLIIVEPLGTATLRIAGSEQEIDDADERLVWNMMLHNHGRPLLARDITTNPMFGSLQADLHERQGHFAHVLDAMNARADRPLVLGHGNNKGRRYGVEPYVHVGPIDWRALFKESLQSVAEPDIAEAAGDILRHYVPESGFVRTFMHIAGVTTERFTPATQLELKDVRKALSEIASLGLAEDHPEVRSRFRAYFGHPEEEGQDKPKKKTSKASPGAGSALADLIADANAKRAGWIGKSECRDTEPDRFHPEGFVGRGAVEKFAGQVEAITGTWCDNCKAKPDCLEYARSMDVKGLKFAGVRIYGGKVFGLTSPQKKNMMKAGYSNLIGELPAASTAG